MIELFLNPGDVHMQRLKLTLFHRRILRSKRTRSCQAADPGILPGVVTPSWLLGSLCRGLTCPFALMINGPEKNTCPDSSTAS
jgi:hypothetical protein